MEKDVVLRDRNTAVTNNGSEDGEEDGDEANEHELCVENTGGGIIDDSS